MNSNKCSSCNLVNFASAKTCNRCGNDLTVQPVQTMAPTINCPHCGNLNSPDAKYCIRCMNLFSAPMTANLFNPIMNAPGFTCPFCHSNKGFLVQSKVSGAGCIVSIILLIFFFPLCWIGLLMKEQQRFCANCSMKLG